MAKLQAINAIMLIHILTCIPLSVYTLSDELITTMDVNVTTTPNVENKTVDTLLLLTTDQTLNVTNDGVYDATIVEITDEPPITATTTLESIGWENTTENGENETVSEPISEPVHELMQTKKLPIKCKNGLILSAWPIENITNGDRFARGLVYFLAMCYLFLGVSIVSDRFMAAIEKITAIEKEVIVRRPDGMKQIVIVRVWNETVANLTLMALGTSAPEILLSIIEIFTMDFQAGELGPGTIVGSAAYNMFCIIAICIVVIPTNQIRRIKHLRVFFVTAAFSIFAYVHLYLILSVFSPGIVTVFESFVTFLFFPLIVWMAYIADRRLFIYKYLNKGYRLNEHGMMVQMETMSPTPKEHRSDSVLLDNGTELLANDFKDPDRIRNDYVCILQHLRQQYPHNDRDTLEMMAQEQLLDSGPKSRAFYRIQVYHLSIHPQKENGNGNLYFTFLLRPLGKCLATEMLFDALLNAQPMK